MIRVALVIGAFLSPFLFPYPFTLFLSFLASMTMPWVALLVGLLVDALFFTPQGGGIPLATILGGVASLGAIIVRRFIKARIMS